MLKSAAKKEFCVVAKKYWSARAGLAGSYERSVKQWQVIAGAAGVDNGRRSTIQRLQKTMRSICVLSFSELRFLTPQI